MVWCCFKWTYLFPASSPLWCYFHLCRMHINLWQFRKVPFMSNCHCITKCFKMQDGRKSLHWEVFPLHPDSCHILWKAASPPPPSQRPPTNFHQPSHPAASLLSTCKEASAWLVFACSSLIFTSCCWRIAMRNPSLIYCHVVSENLLDIWFSCRVCDFVFWFSSFFQLFTGP